MGDRPGLGGQVRSEPTGTALDSIHAGASLTADPNEVRLKSNGRARANGLIFTELVSNKR